MSERKVWTEQDLKDFGFVAPEPEVYSITGAASKHSESVDQRARQYAFRMFLRIVCIVAACLVDGWLRWGFVALAGILPWAAVVVANGDDRANSGGDFMQYLSADQQLALTASQAEAPGGHEQDASTDFTSAPQPNHSAASQHERSAAACPDYDEPIVIDGEIVEPSAPSTAATDEKAS